MEKNDDYKRGYREGFLDGFKAARDNDSLVSPTVPVQQITSKPAMIKCPQCGRSFTDSMGRLIPMSVVCGHLGCPQGITSIQISNTGDITNMNS